MTQKIDGGLPVARPVDAGATATSRAGAPRNEAVSAAAQSDSLRLTGEAAGLQVLERQLGTEPAIDTARVESVRAAIADGSYRIDPQQIASRMIDLEKQLGGP